MLSRFRWPSEAGYALLEMQELLLSLDAFICSRCAVSLLQNKMHSDEDFNAETPKFTGIHLI